MNLRRCILPAVAVVFAGCVNVEHAGQPRDWPRLARVTTTADLRGVYEEVGDGDAGRRLKHLWFYLTRENPRAIDGPKLRLDAPDARHLRASLLAENGGVLRTRVLTSPADFRLANGVVRLPMDFATSTQEGFKWGIGGGWASCALHRATDGSLVGELHVGAVATALFVPAAGFGDEWAHWKKIR